MAVLNIFSLDDTEQQNVIACLPEGKHVIGRGGLLQVSDKRVSRKHAVIEVSNDKVTLTSVHVNPCFFKAFDGKTLIVLAQNQENELNDGDQFALLPENYWFRVKIKRETQEEPPNGKRVHDTDLEGDDSASVKKTRVSPNEEGNPPSTSNIIEESLHINYKDTSQDNENKEESNSSLHLNETALIEDVNRLEVKQEPIDKISEGTGAGIKEEPQDGGEVAQPVAENLNAAQDNIVKTEDDGAGGASTRNEPKRRRERCWYSNTCFRKNPNHRTTFSHPGDQDYDSDPEDDRPDCPFGVACYRKNIDHRREYKHLARPACGPRQQPQNNPANKKPHRRANKKAKTQAASESDDDDYYDDDDSFINDESSDDFQPSDYGTDSSESDWEDSQAVESQERKRMLREAKKFLKNKKD